MTDGPVLIVGGSLAGLSTAIRLKQLGLDARVLEKARFPRPKLCGEFLGPDALPLLDALGVLKAVEGAAWGPVEESRFHLPDGQTWRVPMRWLNKVRPYGLGLSRDRLDWLLLQHARSLGVEVREGARVLPEVRFAQGRFHLRVGEGEPLQTPWLIDASGRLGGLRLAERPAPEREPDRVGISLHVQTTGPADKVLRMFLFQGGYGGIQPLSADESNVCMLVDRSLGAAMQGSYEDFIRRTIGQHPLAREILQGSRRTTAFQTTAGLNMRLTRSPGLLQVGDARLTVDPVTGSGMALALETGMLAAETLAAGMREGAAYPAIQRRYEREYRRRYGLRLALLERFRPVLFSPRAQRQMLPWLAPALPLLARAVR